MMSFIRNISTFYKKTQFIKTKQGVVYFLSLWLNLYRDKMGGLFLKRNYPETPVLEDHFFFEKEPTITLRFRVVKKKNFLKINCF
jgi:hypothetical protein